MRASVVYDLLAQTSSGSTGSSSREKKITVASIVNLLQGLTLAQLEKMHADGCKVFSLTGEPGDIIYIPTGFVCAMRTMNNSGVYGLRFVTLYDSPEARADLAHYQKVLLEGNDVDKCEALFDALTPVPMCESVTLCC